MSQQNSKPKLSIVMPFYNHGDLVAFMIDSIIANDFQDWELLAIDDGSDLATLQFLKKFKSEKRIKVIKRERSPKGAQTCRNIGLNLAQGEYIVFFDSDDYIAPYCLKQRVERLEEYKDLDFLVFPSGTYTHNHFTKEASINSYGYNIFSNDVKAFAKKQLPFIVWNNIYRSKSLKQKNIIWDENVSSLQDADFNLQVLLAKLKYKYILTQPDYGYRIEERDHPISNQIGSKRHIKSHLYHLKKNIVTTQKLYGHKYDKDLHKGILKVYNTNMSSGINTFLASELIEIEKQTGMKSHYIFHLQIIVTKILARLFSPKRARQIPMGIYLIATLLANHKKVKLIKKIQKTISKK